MVKHIVLFKLKETLSQEEKLKVMNDFKAAIEAVSYTHLSVAPQLILMDMNFTLSTSGEEGLTLLKQVKVFRPDVPVILMTAWGSIQLAVQGMQAGAFDFITKPWNNAALLQRIETEMCIRDSYSGTFANGFDFIQRIN